MRKGEIWKRNNEKMRKKETGEREERRDKCRKRSKSEEDLIKKTIYNKMV